MELFHTLNEKTSENQLDASRLGLATHVDVRWLPFK